MGARRLVLIHGAATTSRVWRHVLPLLAVPPPVAVPDRPCTGDLAAETAALRPYCAGAVVVGVSGGATLGLALAAGPAASGAAPGAGGAAPGAGSAAPWAGAAGPWAGGAGPAAAVLHEPAVGSLLPGLLEEVRAAYAAGGVAAFGRALYGPAWTTAEAPEDPAAVGRDLGMFTRFEPAAPAPGTGPVLVTVGECSPAARHESASALAARFGFAVEVIPGAGHAVHLTHPAAFAAVIRRVTAGCA